MLPVTSLLLLGVLLGPWLHLAVAVPNKPDLSEKWLLELLTKFEKSLTNYVGTRPDDKYKGGDDPGCRARQPWNTDAIMKSQGASAHHVTAYPKLASCMMLLTIVPSDPKHVDPQRSQVVQAINKFVDTFWDKNVTLASRCFFPKAELMDDVMKMEALWDIMSWNLGDTVLGPLPKNRDQDPKDKFDREIYDVMPESLMKKTIKQLDDLGSTCNVANKWTQESFGQLMAFFEASTVLVSQGSVEQVVTWEQKERSLKWGPVTRQHILTE